MLENSTTPVSQEEIALFDYLVTTHEKMLSLQVEQQTTGVDNERLIQFYRNLLQAEFSRASSAIQEAYSKYVMRLRSKQRHFELMHARIAEYAMPLVEV